MENILVVGVLLVVAVFWWRGRQTKKAEVWEGVVKDKQTRSSTDSEGDTDEWYMFDIELTDGTRRNHYQVSQKVYERFKIGDKIIKRAGELEPGKP